MKNSVSRIRIVRGIIFALAVVSFSLQLPAQDKACKSKDAPASPTDSSRIPAPQDGVAVTFYDNADDWVGLNHIFASSVVLTHRWRRFIPWMAPGIVSVFPFNKALQSPDTPMPLLYVRHTATALDASEPNARWVHLVRAYAQRNARVVQITSGQSTFSFRPGFTSREEIPLKFRVLSDSLFTIQPHKPLDNGQYLLIFGPLALRGFEFEIRCSGAHQT